MEEGLLPAEKNHFCPQNDTFLCILMQLLTDRKHGQSLEASGHEFYGSIAKRSLESLSLAVAEVTQVTPCPSLPCLVDVRELSWSQNDTQTE